MTKQLRILTFTGFGQIIDAVDAVLPPEAEITHFPYHEYNDLPSVFSALQQLPEQYDVVVGWSLGGRIAAQAVARRVLTPKLFVQMSSGFRFVAGSGLDNAVEKEIYGF